KTSIVIPAKTGDSGRLFGSVTALDIVQAVKKAAGVELDKRKIDLDEPIKMLGEYRVQVKVHPEVSAQLTVRVVEAQGEDARALGRGLGARLRARGEAMPWPGG